MPSRSGGSDSGSEDRQPRSPSRDGDELAENKRRREASASPQRHDDGKADSNRDADYKRQKVHDKVAEGSPKRQAEQQATEGRDDDGTHGANGNAVAVLAATNTASAATERKTANTGKTGGVYIPPFKLARMMQEVRDRSSPEYQRLTWEALKKSINGIVNKVNATNIKNILAEVFQENLIRGRGLFCRSIMKSQLASPTFSAVYAALVCVVNTKFPELGELLLHRLCLQFLRSYKRNDKPVCTAAARFLAHLINQGIAHEVLALEMLILMLEKPSADSIEMACEFTKEVGAYLQEVTPSGLHSVFERFRAVLHEGDIEKRVQFVIEGLFAIRKAGFEASGFPSVKPELDLVEAEDQITHEITLDQAHDPHIYLDVFKVDPDYEQNEKAFRAISREILGVEEESDDEGAAKEGDEQEEEEEEEEEDEEEAAAAAQASAEAAAIEDATQTNLVNLRRTIYLTIMSSLDFEEAGHKIMKIGIQEGQEIEVVTMIIECCAQERTYKRFYGLLAQRFAYVNKAYMEKFDECFRNQYAVIHRLEINKLRNVASLFAHLLVTDAIPWSVLGCIRLTEDDTTSSSRIFIKYLFQELSSSMGVLKLAERLNDPTTQEWYDGIFPKDTQANLRFAINFFTSIGLGGLTDKMREFYKEMPRLAAERANAEAAEAAKMAARARALHGGDTTSESDTDSSDDSDSDSDSSSGSDSSSDSSGSDSSDASDSSDSSSESEDRRRRQRRKASASKPKEALPPPPPLPPVREQNGRGRDGRRSSPVPASRNRDGGRRSSPIPASRNRDDRDDRRYVDRYDDRRRAQESPPRDRGRQEADGYRSKSSKEQPARENGRDQDRGRRRSPSSSRSPPRRVDERRERQKSPRDSRREQRPQRNTSASPPRRERGYDRRDRSPESPDRDRDRRRR